MKNIFLLLISFQPLFLFSQIQIIDLPYNSTASRCYNSLDGDILMLSNGLDVWVDGRTIITEFDNHLNEENVFDFDQTNHQFAEINHILPRFSKNDYLVGFKSYSDTQNQYYLYTASLSSNLDELIVIDSTSLGVDANITFTQGLEIDGFIEYYFAFANTFLNYFIRIDINTGEIIKAGENVIVDDGIPVNLLQIRDVGETITHKLLTNTRRLYFIDKNEIAPTYSNALCWLHTNGDTNCMYKLNFEFTENNEYLIVFGETDKLDDFGRFYTLGRIRFDDLGTGFNKPDDLMIYEEESYSAAINSLFKNEETGEIWAVGSTSDVLYLTDLFSSDFPTKIIVDKFDKKGEHLFHVEFPSEAHIYPWDAVATSDGGLAIVGSYYDFENLQEYRGFIMKLTAEGELLPTSTNNILEEDQLSIFPNPTDGDIQIKVPNSNNMYSFTLRNNLGQTILTKASVSSDTQFSLNHLAEGLYYLHIVDQNGAMQIEKVMKH